MKRASLLPLTITALATLTAFAGHEISRKEPVPPEETLPAGTITAGGKFSSHLESASLDALIPFAKAGNLTLFGDLRGTWDDNSQLLFSTGLGARYLVPGHDIIIGGNVYYDYIDSQYHNHFDQLGLGAELLTKWFDARFNYYLPDSGVRPFSDNGFLRLESGLEGWNVEGGFLIPGLDNYLEARLFAGYYQYRSRVGVGFEGWKARAEIRWTPAIITDIEWWENDSSGSNTLNGGNWIAGVRVSLPFEIGNLAQGRSPFAGAGDALKFGKKREFKERLGDPVWRSHRVQTAVSNPTQRFARGTGNPQQATPSPTQEIARVEPTPAPTPTPTPPRGE